MKSIETADKCTTLFKGEHMQIRVRVENSGNGLWKGEVSKKVKGEDKTFQHVGSFTGYREDLATNLKRALGRANAASHNVVITTMASICMPHPRGCSPQQLAHMETNL